MSMAELGLVRLIFPNRFSKEASTISQRFSSIFSQLLQLFSRAEFERAVKMHRSDYSANGFSSWGQFSAMLFCQIGGAHSLKEICGWPVVKENSNISAFWKIQSVILLHTPMQTARSRSTRKYLKNFWKNRVLSARLHDSI
jgi:hypothetical protein